jgi:hypothetical protein
MVRFIFNAQHDCWMHRCMPNATRPVRQERIDTMRMIKLIKHTEDNHFIVNTHALHNASLLRRRLPRDLVKPKPLFVDRYEQHTAMAQQVRGSQTLKRAETARKGKETREANKRRKLNDEALVQGTGSGI